VTPASLAGKDDRAGASGRNDGGAGRGVTQTKTVNRPRPWLQTPRLELRDFVAGDLDDLYRLDSNPRVMRYVGDGKPSSRAMVLRLLTRAIGYPSLYPALGLWHTSHRDSGEFVGWFSLKYAGKSPDIEVGYRLVPSAWGQGFATEGARAMVTYGFGDLTLERIIGVTHPDNRASQRVLMKAGLEPAGWGHYYDRRLKLFAATRSARSHSPGR